MDHYRHPRNRGTLAHSDFCSASHNPSCGDSVQFQGTIKDGCIDTIVFQGAGCVISQGLASMLTEKVLGMKIADVCFLDKDFVLAMLGMQLGPTRLKCALLPLQALQQGLSNKS